MELTLDTPARFIPRVGPRMAALLEKLGILTVRDFLFDAPFRYNDYSHVLPIRDARPGQTVCIRGTVESLKNVFTKTGKKLQEGIIADESGRMTVIWFNQLYLPKLIHQDDELSLAGTVDFFGNKIAMVSPDWEFIKEEGTTLSTGRIVPVYSQTQGLTSKWLRGRIAFLLEMLLPTIADDLPDDIRKPRSLMPLRQALEEIHFPSDLTKAEDARHRLAFDELWTLQLRSYFQRRLWEQETHAKAFAIDETMKNEFIHHLPFTLTDDQTKALADITRDLERSIPMNRLLEGDVGSGKTVLAAWAIYTAYKNGYSSVLLAPTQILAQQHFSTIQQLLKPFNIPIELILGGNRQKAGDRGQKTEKNKKNPPSAIRHLPSVIIGTHALLEKSVTMDRLGLVVVDEQQRFGVRQRALLRKKGETNLTPHFLTMTATPIPRTIALTLYGNLDLSLLLEMPKGRIPIKTWVVPPQKRIGAYDWIKKQIQETHAGVFIVCPFIDESESMTSVKAAKKEFEYLQKTVFPQLSLGLLHGKMKVVEKTQTLEAFRKGEINILIATPVVEVGIDIPHASIMVIEGADRFGLSQLHQLRGRVGRGNQQAYCLLFTEVAEQKSIQRLKFMEKFHSGPELAQADLEIRGEGDVFGVRQHGIPALTLASLSNRGLVEDVQRAVHEITQRDPDLSGFPLLRETVKNSTIEGGIQD